MGFITFSSFFLGQKANKANAIALKPKERERECTLTEGRRGLHHFWQTEGNFEKRKLRKRLDKALQSKPVVCTTMTCSYIEK